MDSYPPIVILRFGSGHRQWLKSQTITHHERRLSLTSRRAVRSRTDKAIGKTVGDLRVIYAGIDVMMLVESVVDRDRPFSEGTGAKQARAGAAYPVRTVRTEPDGPAVLAHVVEGTREAQTGHH